MTVHFSIPERRRNKTTREIKLRLINKARNSLNMMNKVWRFSTYSTRNKLKLYHSCVLTTLLSVWLRMLALNGEGSIKALHLSHQKPSAYLTHLFA